MRKVVRQELKETLLLLQRLTDDEQETLSSWFSSGGRSVLWAEGIADEVIGPHRSVVDYSVGDFFEDKVPAREPPARKEMIDTVRSLQSLNDEEFEALLIWFTQESRRPLKALGATDRDIGPIRDIPDLAGPKFPS